MLAKFRFKTNGEKNKLKIFRYEKASESRKKLLTPQIEMLSNKELNLDGCKGIIEYNDVYIRIKVSGGEITVTGDALNIPVFEGAAITVSGKIKSVEFNVR